MYFRNDLYLTLEKGEFERGGKSTGKNIEVTILVLDSEGKVLEVCVVFMLCTCMVELYQHCYMYDIVGFGSHQFCI
jgi:dedicator of cytokinesis protein 3